MFKKFCQRCKLNFYNVGFGIKSNNIVILKKEFSFFFFKIFH